MSPEHETVCTLLLLKMQVAVVLFFCKTGLKTQLPNELFTYSKNGPENPFKMRVSTSENSNSNWENDWYKIRNIVLFGIILEY